MHLGIDDGLRVCLWVCSSLVEKKEVVAGTLSYAAVVLASVVVMTQEADMCLRIRRRRERIPRQGRTREGEGGKHGE